mgnify:CR=1 FL=1
MGRNQNRTYTITDDITSSSVTATTDDLERAVVQDMYGDVPDGFAVVLTDMVECLTEGEPIEEHEAYMGVTVTTAGHPVSDHKLARPSTEFFNAVHSVN